MFRPSVRSRGTRRIVASAAALAVGASIFVGVTSFQSANAAETDGVETATQCLTPDAKDFTADPNKAGGDPADLDRKYLERHCWLKNNNVKVYGGSFPSNRAAEDLVGTVDSGAQVVFCQMQSVWYKNNPWWALLEVDTPEPNNRHHDFGYVHVSEFAQYELDGRADNQPLAGLPNCDKGHKAEWSTVDLSTLAATPVTPPASGNKNISNETAKACKPTNRVLKGANKFKAGDFSLCTVSTSPDVLLRKFNESAKPTRMEPTQLFVEAGEIVVACKYNFPELALTAHGKTSGWYLRTAADFSIVDGKKNIFPENVSDGRWAWLSAVDIAESVGDQPIEGVKDCTPDYALNT